MRRHLFYLIGFYVMVALAGCTTTREKINYDSHPRLYVTDGEKQALLAKIEQQEWPGEAFESIRKRIKEYAERHEGDPAWIVSRLAMYWKEGERYTQCYLRDQNWDRGEGNASVPTVRLPGMRTWNKYYNVSLGERTPYNESGDMWG